MNATLDVPVLNDDWLELETAVELIGQMIAFNMGLITAERKKTNPDLTRIADWRNRILELGQEQNDCYDSERKAQVIKKAYNQYVPFLKEHKA